ncbi:Teneurin-1 [Liparis tanakae]|uniref:Teneurin-1 n=1 Tax=Liparis tanakae TaxID=230148 RepID=A0A4Z2EQ24_9TELE|nr:Teneurin-1 [Liparis tanakae]
MNDGSRELQRDPEVTELPSSPGGQFTFRPLPPPPPPPHACTCARPAPYTQVSLQRKTMPTRCQGGQGAADAGSGADPAQLHNSWVLNSNIPLETRTSLAIKVVTNLRGSSRLLIFVDRSTTGSGVYESPLPKIKKGVSRRLAGSHFSGTRCASTSSRSARQSVSSFFTFLSRHFFSENFF